MKFLIEDNPFNNPKEALKNIELSYRDDLLEILKNGKLLDKIKSNELDMSIFWKYNWKGFYHIFNDNVIRFWGWKTYNLEEWLLEEEIKELEKIIYDYVKDKIREDEFIRYNFQFKDIEEIKCKCPEYEIYPDPYCYSSTGGYGSGMNCYNEQWWILYIRCPICGELFEIHDGNC